MPQLTKEEMKKFNKAFSELYSDKEAILNQVLVNQRNMMIHMSKGSYSKGYFAGNIKQTEKILEKNNVNYYF
jgi:hypothetical protein